MAGCRPAASEPGNDPARNDTLASAFLICSPAREFQPLQNFEANPVTENDSTDFTGYLPLSRVCILASGLIGASVGLACKQYGVAKNVSVWSRRSTTRAKANQQTWCDVVYATPEEAAENCDLIVICSPVENIVPLYRTILPSLKRGAIVTDTGSTKSVVCHQTATGHNSLGPFIGSHPMAGSEKTGMEHAQADLFQNRPCIVTPTEHSDGGVVDKIVRFWRALGAVTTIVSPEEHDEIVAHISHLPHLLAASLCAFLSSKDASWANLSSSGLEDATRIASGDPAIWKSIIETNSEEIKRALSRYQEELQQLNAALTNGDMLEIVRILKKGKTFRDRLSG